MMAKQGRNRVFCALWGVWVVAVCSVHADVFSSELAFLGSGGRLEYGTYANTGESNEVNRLPDFSHAGYMGGGVALPEVAVRIELEPQEGDDTIRIQDALDTVAAMEPDEEGFRGAVLLKAGVYSITNTVFIRESGVVLRGEGQDELGTRIMVSVTEETTGQTQPLRNHGAIRIGSTTAGGFTAVAGTQQRITTGYVPTGAVELEVEDASGFSEGDLIGIRYTRNQAWVEVLGMDKLNELNERCIDWTPGAYSLTYERTVASIAGNQLTLDIPLVDVIQDAYGGGEVFLLVPEQAIKQSGLEHLRLISVHAHATDEDHAWEAVVIRNARDCWVRSLSALHFVYAAVDVQNASRITVQDCAYLDPKSTIDGERRYSFVIQTTGRQVLFQRCYSQFGRHDFIVNARVMGPNVFVDGYADASYADTGPHHRWASGTLFDNIYTTHSLAVENRLTAGTGHGWSGVNTVFWNCEAGVVQRCFSPTGGMNFAIGSKAEPGPGWWTGWDEEDGWWEHRLETVTPRSLYYQQLVDRLGTDALEQVTFPAQRERGIWPDLKAWAGRYAFQPSPLESEQTHIEFDPERGELTLRVEPLPDAGITAYQWVEVVDGEWIVLGAGSEPEWVFPAAAPDDRVFFCRITTGLGPYWSEPGRLITAVPLSAGGYVIGQRVEGGGEPGYYPEGGTVADYIGSAGGASTRTHYNPVLRFDLPDLSGYSGIGRARLSFYRNAQVDNQAMAHADLYGLDPRGDGFALDETLWYQGADPDTRTFVSFHQAQAVSRSDADGTHYLVDVTGYLRSLYDGTDPQVESAWFRFSPDEEVAPEILKRLGVYNQMAPSSSPFREPPMLLIEDLGGGRRLLDETWPGGDRSVQDLPGSAAWFSSQEAETLTAEGGSMTQTLDSTAVALAYFTDDEPVTLMEGDRLRLEYQISMSGVVIPGSFLRIGLMDSSGGHRVAADRTGYNNPAFVGVAGYNVEINGLDAGRRVDTKRREHDASSDNLITSTGSLPYTNFASLKSGDFHLSEDLTEGTVYHGVIEVTRQTGEIHVAASLARPDGEGGQVMLYDLTSVNANAARLYHAFDTVAFAIGGSAASSFTLHQVRLSWQSDDLTPPQPDPMEWAVAPEAVRPTRIAMTAATAVDELNGVEYYFENMTDPSHNSGWRSDPFWTDTGLMPETEYTYRVMARDTSANRNRTGWSVAASAWTPVETDETPPSPDPMQWAEPPAVIGYNTLRMAAVVAVDAEGNTPVEYYFENMTDPSRSSGWQEDPVHLVSGLAYDTEYTYRVKARDSSYFRNETGWSETRSVQTEPEPVLLPSLRKTMLWDAPATGRPVPVHIYYHEETTDGRAPVFVYVRNHGLPRIGLEPDDTILPDYLDEGMIVITMDFGGDPGAVSPVIDADLHSFFLAVYGEGAPSILADAGLVPEPYLCWFVPAGYRLARDIVYFDLAGHGSHGTKEWVLNEWNTSSHVQSRVTGWTTLTDPDEMWDRDGQPLDWTLKMDVVYPSQPAEEVPLVIWAGTGSRRNMMISPSYYRPHFAGFVMRGYAYAHIDHCYNPLARHWTYGHYNRYSLQNFNGLKSNSAAVRYLRVHAGDYGLDPERFAAWGHSKGSYAVTRLSDPGHAGQAEWSTFDGYPPGTPEEQPWPGVSSQIHASYQSMGDGTRRPELVTPDQVPTIIACGELDQRDLGAYDEWFRFPRLVHTYETNDVNHLALWIQDVGHDLPQKHNPVLDVDNYAVSQLFFDQYLMPDQRPELLYILPKDGREGVRFNGYSQKLPDRSILPASENPEVGGHWDEYVTFDGPVTVHFGQPMDVASVQQGGIEIVRVEDGMPVHGEWVAARGDTLFWFDAEALFLPDTLYRITVRPDVVNQQGRSLRAGRSIEFRTAPDAPPDLFNKTITANDWLMGRPEAQRTITNGVLSSTLSETTTFVAYLTGNKGQKVTLDEGQTLRFNYSISFGGIIPGTASLRVGAFDTDLSTHDRITGFRESAEDDGGWISATAADTFRFSLGYASWLDSTGENSSVNVRRRRGENQTGLIAAAGRFWAATGSDTLSEGISADTVYHGVVEIYHNGVDDMHYRAALWYDDGGDDVFLYDFTTESDTSSITYTPDFDLVTIHATGAWDSIKILSSSVEVVSEQATAYDAWAESVGLPEGSRGKEVDYDGDGLTNWQEYIAWSNPLRAEAPFAIRSIVADEAGVTVHVEPAVDGRMYILQARDSLTEGAWTNVTERIPGAQARPGISMEQGERVRFYRAGVELP